MAVVPDSSRGREPGDPRGHRTRVPPLSLSAEKVPCEETGALRVPGGSPRPVAGPAAVAVLEDAAPGVRAAQVAEMRCCTVPYDAGRSVTPGSEVPAGEAVFRTVELPFPTGRVEFTAAAVLEWVVTG
ncbi:hypothetical protein ACYCCF_01990 [Streptomyces argenteolus]